MLVRVIIDGIYKPLTPWIWRFGRFWGRVGSFCTRKFWEALVNILPSLIFGTMVGLLLYLGCGGGLKGLILGATLGTLTHLGASLLWWDEDAIYHDRIAEGKWVDESREHGGPSPWRRWRQMRGEDD